MAAGLVRVSIAAGTRRADVALPGAVPVAELVPDLARALGVPEGRSVLATVTGRRLVPEQGLAAQDVPDGSVLLLTSADLPPSRIHDDLAEAMAEAVEEYVAPWPHRAGRPAALVAAALLLGTAGGTVLRPLALDAPAAARCLLAVAALLVLAGSTFPRWALAAAGRQAAEGLVDLDRTKTDARAAHGLLLAMVGVTGLLLLAVAPLAAGIGPWAVLLVVDCAGVLALRIRHHRSVAQVVAGLVTAFAAVLGAVTDAAAEHPALVPRLAAALAAAGVLLVAGVVVPASPRRARAAELLEAAVVVALLPLLVTATGVLPWVRAVVAR